MAPESVPADAARGNCWAPGAEVTPSEFWVVWAACPVAAKTMALSATISAAPNAAKATAGNLRFIWNPLLVIRGSFRRSVLVVGPLHGIVSGEAVCGHGVVLEGREVCGASRSIGQQRVWL